MVTPLGLGTSGDVKGDAKTPLRVGQRVTCALLMVSW